MYTINELKQLINVAEKSFDIVLIDGGCHYDNAGLFAALSNSGIKVLVANQQAKTWKKFNDQYEQILSQLGYHRNDFWLMINQYVEHAELPTTKDLIKRYAVPYLCTIPSMDSQGMAQEYLFNEQLLDLEEIQQNVQVVVKAIAHQYDLLPLIQQNIQVTKKRWISGLFHKLGGQEKYGGV